MRKLAQIENGVVVNVIAAPALKTETEITDALQQRQAALMQVKNDDETPYYTSEQIADALASYEAELRADPWADYPDAGGAQIGDTYDAETGVYTRPEPVIVAADLSRRQFEYMLALTGFGDVWDALAQAAKDAGNLDTFAALSAERKAANFNQERTLAVVAQFRDQAAFLAPGIDLSDAAIKTAWAQAETYSGLGV